MGLAYSKCVSRAPRALPGRIITEVDEALPGGVEAEGCGWYLIICSNAIAFGRRC